MGFTRDVLARVLLTLVVLVAFGCSPDENPPSQPRGKGQFGDRCAKTEDCSSGLCLRVEASSGLCTAACENDGQCPASVNWTCAKSSIGTRVCACHTLAESEVCGDAIDNDCDAKIDDCRICNGIAVPEDDPRHCGQCDKACRSDQSCAFGSCICTGDRADDCGGACTNTKTDSGNCGSCGNACGADRVCTDGTCVCPNSAEPNYCEGVGCVDTATDVNHCGTCGNGCTLAQVCQGGACVCPAGSPQDFCPGVGCVNRQTDSKNCGTCGNVCPSDKVCSQGACVCPQGKTDCGGVCIDTQTDGKNCGECGKSCPVAQACRTGSCGCTSFGLTVCGDECADLGFSTTHCGACSIACLPGEQCSSGTCVCYSGLVCSGQCISSSDDANCGSCGRACPTGQFCQGGGCACQGFGLSPCGSACVDLNSDEANCGVCGRVCPTGQSCSGGYCDCPPGQTYCAAANGCVDLSSSTSYCGSCDIACKPTETCSSGQCRCPLGGQVNCPSVNACVDVNTNTQHCGTCDHRCNPTEVCSSGYCLCPSSFNERFCSSENACVDVYSNNQHCGGCDIACPAGTQCNFGTCTCTQAGFTLCGSTCYDLANDPRHCGSCTNSCPGNYTCTGSQCKCPDPTVGTAVRLTNNSIDEYVPAVAWDGTHVGVAYAQSTGSGSANVRFALLNPNGTLVSDRAITTYTTDGMSSRPGLAWSGTEYALVWDSASTSIMFQRLDATGASKGAAVDVAGGLYSPQNPAVAWSAGYGGYSVAFHSNSQLHFRRVGATAASLETVNTVSGLYVYSSRDLVLHAAPNGTWAIATGGSYDVSLTIFNADGSRTLPPQTLTSNVPFSGGPDLVHDGTNWLTAWTYSGSTSIGVNRGTAANSPSNVVTAVNPAHIGEAVLGMVDGTLAVGWLQRPSSSGAFAFRLQRFAIPSTTSSAVTSIHNAVDILPTQNTGVNDIALASTGDALVAVWADNRWGATREIYAAPINLRSCP